MNIADKTNVFSKYIELFFLLKKILKTTYAKYISKNKNPIIPVSDKNCAYVLCGWEAQLCLSI